MGIMKKYYHAVVFAIVLFVINASPLFATTTVSNVTVSPGAVTAGSDITVDFTFTAGNSNMSWAVYFRPYSDGTTVNTNWSGTSGQDLLVDNNIINNLCSACGEQIGTTTSGVTTGTPQQISSYESVVLTVPASYADGTYSLIVLVRDGTNIYINSFDNQAYTTFEVGGLAPAKSASVSGAAIGDTITYCITSTNLTGSSATFDIWDTVPANMTYVGCDNTCAQSGGVVSWTISSLANGGTVKRCFWVEVSGLPYMQLRKTLFAYVRNTSAAMLDRKYSTLELASFTELIN